MTGLRNLKATGIILIMLISQCKVFSQEGSAASFYNTDDEGRMYLSVEGASHFARLALDCMQREYPNKLNQVLSDSSKLKSPRELHPAFYGCFDWHSSVHGHWMLVRLLRQFPELPERKEIRKKLNENLRPENILAEAAYFREGSKSFERMYGWSWLLKLAEELHTWNTAESRVWSAALQPLTDIVVQRYLDFLPVQQYPVRTGVHPNTAFGLSFAWDYAHAVGHDTLKLLIEDRSRDYYMEDVSCPAGWEPSGEDFLSPCLEEANLMSRFMEQKSFSEWFKRFLPERELKSLAIPADVSDRSDPKIVHLDGLNLSRAWCLYRMLPKVQDESIKRLMTKAAAKHLLATIPHVAAAHYEGSHWLASFAVYALSQNSEEEEGNQ